MPRILFVMQSGYLPRTITGANISLHGLCNRLVARGFECTVICTPEPEGAGQGAPELPPFGYDVVRHADPVAAMNELSASLAPDAIVVRAPDPAERAVRTAANLNRPLHIYFESGFFGRTFPPPRDRGELRYAACSPFLARMAAAYFAAPIRVVPPLIETEDFRCAPAGDSILFVNPTASKGVHIAAAIAARLPHRRFLFVRSWPPHVRYPHLETLAPNVHWADSTFDMRPLLAAAKLVLVPSVWEEGWGRVVTEAQISGIPAVATDRGALRETVGPGGVVLPLAAPIERWCEVIERVYADPAHFAALSAHAKAHAARSDSRPEAAVARFLDFIAA